MVNEKISGGNEKGKSKEEPAEKIERLSSEMKQEKQQPRVAKPTKKNEAVVNAKDLPISTKYSVAICKMIRKNTIDNAIAKLQEVVAGKRAVKMYGDEIPHRKGIMSGRYPIKATKQFIKLLRNLAANSSVNGLDLAKVRIAVAKADTASRTRYHRKYRKFKRTHVTLIAREVVEDEKNKLKKENAKASEKQE